MHVVLVNRLGGLSLPRKSVVRLTDRPHMTLDVYRGRKTTIQQQRYIVTESAGTIWWPGEHRIFRRKYSTKTCFEEVNFRQNDTSTKSFFNEMAQ